jgi:hypothetical protein
MNSPHDIPNESLTLEHLPNPDDVQLEWIQFALTFDGYAEKGGHKACATFANEVRENWKKDGELPSGLSDLRAALFYEQRRWRWSNEDPFTDEEWLYWRSLVNAIKNVLSEEDESPAEEITHSNLQGSDSRYAKKVELIKDIPSAETAMLPGKIVNNANVEPSTIERTVGIYSETDDYGGSRYVWLRLTEEGKFVLEGQDLGGDAMNVFGTGEYEWAWSLAPEQLSDFLSSLGVKASQSADLLESIANALKKLERNKIQKCFKDAGAAFWSRVGD